MQKIFHGVIQLMPTRMKIENKEIEISFAAKLLIMISD